jgi:ABC-type cobalamin/Fe3+-siderophores transport system ATPase subunit
MNVLEQIAQLSQVLPPEKQAEVLEFVEFLISRQPHTTWTVEQRREIVARTMGCLRHTHTSSQAFAQRKQEEKAKEERRWTS